MMEPATNLYRMRSSFVGRAQELRSLEAWLAGERRPLLSILGPPGAGKTRLARHFAEACLGVSAPRGGVWFVELAAARGAGDVAAAVAGAFGLTITSYDTVRIGTAIGEALATRGPMLLVLDNFEHLVDRAAGALATWLRVAPEMAVLVTTQRRLRIEGERLLPLGPLPLPPEAPRGLAEVTGCESVALFLDRVRAVRADYLPADADALALATLVRRLDGMPLALELAATRMSVLDAPALLERLERRFALLRRASLDADPRQATLEAAIGWAWEQLDPAEASVLAQCAVFRGGFELPDAEAVLDLGANGAGGSVLDLLESLWERSLLARSGAGGRFQLLESIRDYAKDRLRGAGQAEAVIDRHGAHYGARAADLAERVEGRGGGAALAWLGRERENLQAAVERAGPSSGPTQIRAAVQAALGLHAWLCRRGPGDLHQSVLATARQAVAAHRGGLALEAHRLQLAEAQRLRECGLTAEALTLLEEVRVVAEAEANQALLARAHRQLAQLTLATHDLEACAEHTRRAREAARQTGDTLSEAYAELKAAQLLWARGDLERAVAALTAVRDRLTRLEADELLGFCAITLGTAHRERGALEEAEAVLADGLARFEGIGHSRYVAQIASILGDVLGDLGRAEEAFTHHERALQVSRLMGDLRREGWGYQGLGTECLDLGSATLAADHFLKGSDLFRRSNCPQEQALCGVAEAFAHATSGDLRRAEAVARAALSAARGLPGPALWAFAAGTAGAIAVALGDAAGAQPCFAEAEAALPGVQDLGLREAARVLLGFRDLGRGDAATAASTLHSALQRSAGPPIVHRALWARLAARWLFREVPPDEQLAVWASAVDPGRVALLVDAAGRRFRPPGGTWTALEQRPQLWTLLALLVADRERGGTGLHNDDVLAGLWPGERMLPEAAAMRVYKSVSDLRKQGLKAAIVKADDLYAVAPEVAVLRVPPDPACVLEPG